MEFNNALLLIYVFLYVFFTILYSIGLLDAVVLLATLIYSIGLVILFKKEVRD